MALFSLRPLIAVLLAAAWTLPLAACQSGAQAQRSVFAMDTVMSLTIHGRDQEACQRALDQAVEKIYALEALLSVTREDSQIYALNHAQGQPVQDRKSVV